MKIIMAFLLICLSFCDCSRRQAGEQSQIVGTWEASSGEGQITFYPNGYFSSDWHYNISHSNLYDGKWQIAADILTITVTNASGTEPHERIEHTDHYKISRMEGSDLVCSDLSQTNVPLAFTREK
jgi:hypothetical protein